MIPKQSNYPFYVDYLSLPSKTEVYLNDGKGTLRKGMEEIFSRILHSFIKIKLDGERKILLNPYIYLLEKTSFYPSKNYYLKIFLEKDVPKPAYIILHFFTSTPINLFYKHGKGGEYFSDGKHEELPILEHLYINAFIKRCKYYRVNKTYTGKCLYNMSKIRNGRESLPFLLRDGKMTINNVCQEGPLHNQFEGGFHIKKTLEKWWEARQEDVSGDDYLVNCFINNMQFQIVTEDGESFINIDELEELLIQYLPNLI